MNTLVNNGWYLCKSRIIIVPFTTNKSQWHLIPLFHSISQITTNDQASICMYQTIYLCRSFPTLPSQFYGLSHGLDSVPPSPSPPMIDPDRWVESWGHQRGRRLPKAVVCPKTVETKSMAQARWNLAHLKTLNLSHLQTSCNKEHGTSTSVTSSSV